jgi:hypothetical protein
MHPKKMVLLGAECPKTEGGTIAGAAAETAAALRNSRRVITLLFVDCLITFSPKVLKRDNFIC